LEQPTVVIGDSTVVELTEFLKTDETGVIGGTSLPDVVRKLHRITFVDVVVVIGRDGLLSNEPIDQLIGYCDRLLQLLLQYPKITVHWVPPPYVHQKSAAKVYTTFLCSVIRLIRLIYIVYTAKAVYYFSRSTYRILSPKTCKVLGHKWL